jgi:hypothetical protein
VAGRDAADTADSDLVVAIRAEPQGKGALMAVLLESGPARMPNQAADSLSSAADGSWSPIQWMQQTPSREPYTHQIGQPADSLPLRHRITKP